MDLEYNFDSIVLLPAEMRMLKKSKHHPVSKDINEHLQSLYKADLVYFDASKERDEFNRQKQSHTAHISDKGLRYLIWLRRQKMRSIYVPIIVAVAASLLANGIIWLLQRLL